MYSEVIVVASLILEIPDIQNDGAHVGRTRSGLESECAIMLVEHLTATSRY